MPAPNPPGVNGVLISQSLKQTLQQKIDPKLIMANTILQLSQMELQQVIEQELAENPALELPEDDPCQGCETPKSLCIDCAFRKQTITSDDVDLSIHEIEQPIDFTGDDEDGENDFISNIEAEVTLQDHLRTQLHGVATAEQFEIGDYLIANIGENGYLECDLEEAAGELQVSTETVEAVLQLIQKLDPPGVGARNLQECLRLQLEQLAEQGQGNEVALAIVRDFWSEMIAGKVGRIARRLKVPLPLVNQALRFIKERLNPYPGNAFRPPWNSKLDNLKSTVRPDVIVRRTPAGYEIEVVTTEQFFLAINAQYRQTYNEIKNGGGKRLSEEEKKHIVEFVERADLFIRNINQRRRTLRQITRAIVEYQQGYLETGSRAFLRPLTRTRIARALKMHESTVSRATSNKYVQLPSEEVVSFDFFFDNSVSVKDLIEELISSEDKSDPLSDQAIAEILQQRGLNVARRTVVKYRGSMKILSSRQRRR